MARQFEKSIAKYFENPKQLEYLDLAFPVSECIIKEDIKFYCFCKGFKHEVHTENKQLNFIADGSLSSLSNIAYLRNQIALLSKITIKYQKEIQPILEILNSNLNQLKSQSISYTQVAELISSVFDKPKAIESESLKLVNKLDKRIDKLEALINKLIDHII